MENIINFGNIIETPPIRLGPDIDSIWYLIALLSHSLVYFLIIANFIICIFIWIKTKKIRENRCKVLIVIIAGVISHIGTKMINKLIHTNFELDVEPLIIELFLKFSLVIFPFIIELIIFIKLIMSIIKNKKKTNKPNG